MGLKREWADADHKILLIIIESPWTWEDYRASADVAFEEIKTLDYSVALIIDVTHVTNFPRGDILGNLNYIEKNIPPNIVMTVTLGGPYVVTAFMNIFTQLKPSTRGIVRFAKTMDEARSIVMERLDQVSQNTPE
jgi:hypothetical protein